MEINTNLINDSILEIVPNKEITIANYNEFKENTLEIIEKNDKKKIIMNFENINYIDSSGIGSLISIYHNLSKKNGDMKFIGVKSMVAGVFAVTRLNKVFKIEKDLKEALKNW